MQFLDAILHRMNWQLASIFVEFTTNKFYHKAHLLTLYSESLSIGVIPSGGDGLAFVQSSMGYPYRAEFQCAHVSHSTVISRGFMDATIDHNTIRACPLHIW